MRLVIQRCLRGSVEVAGETVGAIGPGLVVLVGIEENDTAASVERGLRPVLKGRFWADEESGKSWRKTVVDMQYEILLVSQFTLLATLARGARPDFRKAMRSPESQNLFNQALRWLKEQYLPDRIQTGRFGQLMQVSLVNDGPVTLVIDEAGASESEFFGG